jgi:hypothetical protein
MLAAALVSSGALAQKPRGARKAQRPAAAAAPEPVPAPEASDNAETSPPAADPSASTNAAPSSAEAPSTPAATPPAGAAAAPAADTAEDDAELAALRQELAQVMDDLVQARARVAMLGKSLFKTSVRVKVDNRAAPDQIAGRAALWLDGAPIWSGDGAGLRDAAQVLFDGGVAPGPHVFAVEIEQRSRDDDAYRYTLHDTYHFTALRERRTDLLLVLDDDSGIASDFEDDEEGEYDVRTRLEVRAMSLGED